MSVHLVADLKANAERFVETVKATGEVWGLKSVKGWAYCPSNHSEADVLLFWSDRAYAARHANAEWSAYKATLIPIDSFIDGWLRGMQADGLLVGVNFNSDLAGLEFLPAELAGRLVGDA